MIKDRNEKNNMINATTTVSRHAWLTLAILSSTLLTVFFSETMLLPAIPEIINDLDISYGTAAWIFSAYLIVAAVMTPVAGRLSDLFGKKKVLLSLLVIYITGLIAGGFADNITFLLISRIIQGVGLAAIPAAFSLLRDTFPPAKLSIACRGLWFCIFSWFSSGTIGWSGHNPNLWLACYFPGYNTFLYFGNIIDCKICKGI